MSYKFHSFHHPAFFHFSMISTYGEMDRDRDFRLSRLRDRRAVGLDRLSPPRCGDRRLLPPPPPRSRSSRPSGLVVRSRLLLARRFLLADAGFSFSSSCSALLVLAKSRGSKFLERRPRGPACLRNFNSVMSVSFSSSSSSASASALKTKRRHFKRDPLKRNWEDTHVCERILYISVLIFVYFHRIIILGTAIGQL